MSVKTTSRTKESLSKVLPLRWSLGSKDRRKPEPVPSPDQGPAPAELVQYLESGRRPRCTKDPIESLMSGPPKTREAAQGQTSKGRSSSVSNMSCLARAGEDGAYESPQVPQGQRRSSEKTASLRHSKKDQPRVETTAISSSSSSNTLARRKDSRKQSSSKDGETKRRPSSGVQPSYSTPSLRDGTLGRNKGEKADRSSVEKGKSNASSCLGDELANGKLGRTSDIKRSQSSSNIPTKAEPSMRRTSSLHRNGTSAGHAPSRNLTTDKPSYGTLQRTRYSTSSLGRKRTVPESSF